ncbi:MAG: alpha/beta fold hydrolase [Alphaproteobacteria bacterium]|nr:alpha/beta fold hydrolase [Alphaproteobacteria bacterium]
MAKLKPLATWSGHRRANVVFIHGLGGHEIETWRASDGSGGFWPHWLAEDVPGTAVFTLPHQSTQTLWRGEAMAWQDSAATMLRELLAEPDLSTGPIVLICHSLGGVLAKALLLKARSETTLDGAEEFLQRVRLVVFLSTPHAGSPIAGWLKYVKLIFRPTDLTVSLAAEAPALRGLNSEYVSLSNQRRGDLAHRVYYESQKTRGILVVTPSSANPGLPDMPYPVMIDGANHITVCKPTTRDALIVREITAALKALDPDSNHESGVLTLHQGQQATVPGHGEAVPSLVGQVPTLPRRVGLVARWMLAEWRDQKDLQQNAKSIKQTAEEQIKLSKEILEKLSTENAVPIEVLQSILLQMDIHAFGKSKDETVALLTKKAMEYRDLVSRLTDKTEAVSETQPLIDQAKQALVSGDFTKANTLLALAEQQDLAAATQHQTAVVDRRRSAAQARAERASLALLRPSRAAYREAADHFAAAAEMVEPVTPDVAWQYRCDQGKTLRKLGAEFGENSILAKAIDHFKTLLHATDRQANPLRWSSLQVYLGNALRTLGERDSGTARLEEAVTAYRAALAEYTRERVPLDWATIQNNLGNALQALGQRESGTARLEEAVTAYRAALEERTRKLVPLDWATTQNNLGAALRTLERLENRSNRDSLGAADVIQDSG